MAGGEISKVLKVHTDHDVAIGRAPPVLASVDSGTEGYLKIQASAWSGRAEVVEGREGRPARWVETRGVVRERDRV